MRRELKETAEWAARESAKAEATAKAEAHAVKALEAANAAIKIKVTRPESLAKLDSIKSEDGESLIF